jgi:SpoVK/Ycf46/Vps4 family AAA+-type ATPase
MDEQHIILDLKPDGGIEFMARRDLIPKSFRGWTSNASQAPSRPCGPTGSASAHAVDHRGQRRYRGPVPPIPFARLFGRTGRRAVETIAPRRTFDDVILAPGTRRALDSALGQVTQHDLVFNRWGFGERHPTGLALAFNFAGPPGTGKTICAEAIAHALGQPLLLVRYAELESLWMGETPKNVSAIFRAAEEQRAVLLFDEADAVASRRSTAVDLGVQRESNTVVTVLLQELERYGGVVIFATNLSANFDPAFERRIRTHVVFEMPGPAERAEIWRVQMHPERTPLAPDVNFEALAQRYAVSGGDIRNAVLKAAVAAASEPGPDSAKRIHHRHLEAGIEEVVAGKGAMQQSLFVREERLGSQVDAATVQVSRLVAYPLAVAAAALLVAIIALTIALFK